MLNLSDYEFGDEVVPKPYWIRNCIHKETKAKLFVQKFSLLQHYTSEIIRFLSSIMKLKQIKIENFIDIVGFSIDSLDIYVFYENIGLEPVDFSILGPEDHNKLLTDIARALLILHKYEAYHLAVKRRFIFKDLNNSYRIGFITPLPHDTIDPDDEINPLFDNKLCHHDIFLYGLLRADLLFNNSREEILDRIWNLKDALSVKDQLTESCLCLCADQRPSFSEFATTDRQYPEKLEFSHTELFNIVKDIKPIAGSCYLNGFGVEKDVAKAREIFSSSPDPISLNDMAKFVIQNDHNLALQYLLKSTESNFSVALKNTGVIYLQDGHIKEGIKFLMQSAALGFHDAILIVADTFVRSNTNIAFKYIERAAKHGDTRALVNLGLYYEHAWGCKQDFRMMAGLWVLAAKIGNEQALNNIGVHVSSRETAMKLWSNLHDPVSFFNIGNILLKKGQQFREQGIEMMKHAADAGYVPAMFNMAVLLREKNPEEADMWCTKASQAKANELVMEARMKEIASIAADSL